MGSPLSTPFYSAGDSLIGSSHAGKPDEVRTQAVKIEEYSGIRGYIEAGNLFYIRSQNVSAPPLLGA